MNYVFLLLFLISGLAHASVTVSVNGTSHTIPQTNERGWGTNVTAWIQAISQYTLQNSGGTFTLTSEVNTGATYGFKVPYIKTATSTPSTAGVLRLARADGIGWRNQANGANLLLEVDSSNRLTFNSVLLATATAASVQDSTFSIYDNGDSTKLIAFQASGITTGTTRTITMPDSNVDLGGLVNANIATGAAIARSKIASGTADHVVINSGAGALSSEATLAVARGGTNLASGTSGGVLAYTASGTLASSAALASGQVVLGGGAGTVPATLAAGTSGQYLKSNASSAATWASFIPRSMQVFTSGTAATYTTPAGITAIEVTVVGGGGGGGGTSTTAAQSGAGGGGGGGCVLTKLITSPAATYTYTVGPGGAGGTAGTNDGTAGTTSTFSGGTLSAQGGSGGGGSSNSATPVFGGSYGAGGACTNGDVQTPGDDGSPGQILNGTTQVHSGRGGGNPLGPATHGVQNTSGTGVAASQYGAGGSGGADINGTSSRAGGAGAAGVIIVREFGP